MENSEIIFEGENYRGKETYSYRSIVLSQLQRCVLAGSQEFREGFNIYSQQTNQQGQKIKYIGDSREEYWNSIDVFYDLLLPKFDSEMKKQGIKIYQEAETRKEKALEDIRAERGKVKSIEKKFYEDKLKIYRKLFQQLCLFLDRENFLEAMEIHD